MRKVERIVLRREIRGESFTFFDEMKLHSEQVRSYTNLYMHDFDDCKYFSPKFIDNFFFFDINQLFTLFQGFLLYANVKFNG